MLRAKTIKLATIQFFTRINKAGTDKKWEEIEELTLYQCIKLVLSTGVEGYAPRQNDQIQYF